MTTGPDLTDEEVMRLAEAERDAGVPDVQTAAAASDAKQRLATVPAADESEAHPS